MAPARCVGNRVAVVAEDRVFGARRIVLGQFADRAEQRTAQSIVKIPRRDVCGARLQSHRQCRTLGGGIADKTFDNTGVGHTENLSWLY